MDPLSMTAVGSAIAGVTGSALNYFGARRANEMNIAEARRQEGFQSGVMDRQERFAREMYAQKQSDQERLSNTAYQRAMEDMRRSGINPMMVSQLGGASTPISAAPSLGGAQGSKAHIENQIAPAVNSGLAMLRSISEIQSIQAQVDVAKSMVLKNVAGTKYAEASTLATQKQTSWIDWDRYTNFGKSLLSGVQNIGSLAYYLGRITGKIK